MKETKKKNGFSLTDEQFEKIKKIVTHVGLYVGLVAYTAIGAKIFQIFESPFEMEKLEIYKGMLVSERQIFLNSIISIWNNSSGSNSSQNMENLEMRLTEYEQVVEQAVDNGINIVTQDMVVNWDYIQAIFFVITILTTIGYGHFAPVTMPGRLFCILFAIIGIPFTLSVIADMGQIIATLMTTIWDKYKQRLLPYLNKLKPARNKEKKKLIVEDEEKSEGCEEVEEQEDEDTENIDVGFMDNIKTAGGALLLLCLFLSCGAYFISIYENISFFNAFYFCFITMTTIGFGDIVPDFVGGDKSGYMLVVTIYILVGMTVFTTIIEIVRRQYAESWRKMQELRAQIQAQLKLADHLRKLGEAGELDEAAQAELDAIQKKLGKYKGKYGKEIGIDELEWEDKDKKVKAVTIIFYETSL